MFYDYIIFNCYLINEVLFIENNYFVSLFLLFIIISCFWVTYSVSSMSYLGVPNSAQ